MSEYDDDCSSWLANCGLWEKVIETMPVSLGAVGTSVLLVAFSACLCWGCGCVCWSVFVARYAFGFLDQGSLHCVVLVLSLFAFAGIASVLAGPSLWLDMHSGSWTRASCAVMSLEMCQSIGLYVYVYAVYQV